MRRRQLELLLSLRGEGRVRGQRQWKNAAIGAVHALNHSAPSIRSPIPDKGKS